MFVVQINKLYPLVESTATKAHVEKLYDITLHALKTENKQIVSYTRIWFRRLLIDSWTSCKWNLIDLMKEQIERK